MAISGYAHLWPGNREAKADEQHQDSNGQECRRGHVQTNHALHPPEHRSHQGCENRDCFHVNEKVDGEAKPPAVSVEQRQGHSSFRGSHGTTLHSDLHHMHGISRASDEKDDRYASAIDDR